ncbi:MAG: TRAP transporter small permease [Desulfobacterales bacterium]|jgi:TRAP-type C4-dicarboxylate transport system permease small subunit|nr:TRAP transporter small permease [Desulfobacterales bacterium]
MISFLRIEKIAAAIAEKVNWIAAAAVAFTMILITADVALRFFRRPITGTYEIVGFMGTVIIAFALPYTSVQKGHIAVDFLMIKLPWLARVVVNAVNSLVCMVFFAVISWQCVEYARNLKASGEVSATLQMPTYPFIYGVAIGFALLVPVLLIEFIRQLKGAEIQ